MLELPLDKCIVVFVVLGIDVIEEQNYDVNFLENQKTDRTEQWAVAVKD